MADVLVVGSGTAGSGTEELYRSPGITITGIDVYESSSVNCIADAHYIPLPDACIDGVWIQAVLEHVVEPSVVVAEIHRVLKTNGLIYAETPFMQQVHEGAFDFTRFTVLGHRYLFRDFEMIDCGGNKGPAIALAWSIRYFFWALLRSATMARFIGLLSTFALRPFEFLTDRRALHDASSGVFFLGKKSNRRIKHGDLQALYEGLQKRR
ncbi:MAG: class I SAM-dependent methyltransferase [Hyphomicrobiales bacterium]